MRVELDDRDLRGGEKYWQWVKKGVPITVEIGPRDLENGTVFVGRRDLGGKREGMQRDEFFPQLVIFFPGFKKTFSIKLKLFRKNTQK